MFSVIETVENRKASSRKSLFKQVAFGGLLVCALIMTVLVAASFGAANISAGHVLTSLQAHLTGHEDQLINKSADLIVWNIRMPRIFLSIVIGMALSSAGVVFQAVFKNPMADPYVLGISSGAAFGAALVIVSGYAIMLPLFSTVAVGAFVGASVTSIVVWQISKVGGKTETMTLLLSGIALNFMLQSGLSMIMVFNREQIERIVFWTMGSMSSATWAQVGIMLIPVTVAIALFRLYARDLNIMLMGEEVAQSLGVHVEKLRIVLLMIASAVTAAAVSVSGIIGFVGLIVPHAVRMIVGPDHRQLIPFSILAGGVFLLVADTVARTLFAPAEIPIGVMTAFIGSPYFIYLMQCGKSKKLGR